MPTRPRLDELQEFRRYGIGRLLLLARRDFISRLAYKMNHGGDMAMQARGRLLPYIDVDGTRSIDLARRMGVTKQAVARMVKELEEEGLVYRTADDGDGRAALVKFTKAGLQYLSRLHKNIAKIERDYERLVGEDQMKLVRQTLIAIAYAGEDEAGSRGTPERESLLGNT
jgi:DNA-binding MarR family transcriptional regulator